MLKKGIISNKRGSSAEVVLPDEDNTVTAMLPFARSIAVNNVNIGDKCVVAIFDDDSVSLANGAIIAIL